MHDYTEMRKQSGYSVNQTLDAPIMLFEIWELSEVFVALGLVLIFGVIFYEWALLCFLILLTLVGLPYLRKNFNKGIAFHYFYRRFGMHLPGIANPGGRARRSD
jgi:Na+/glutamate symporter